jgi:hypothetical protein
MEQVGANPEPIKREDAYLCTCPHDNKRILILYKFDNPKELVCKSCFKDPDLFNLSNHDIDVIYDIETGEKLQ